MTTEWVVSAGVERVELKASGTAEAPGPSLGELQFTVTNNGPVEDRAVFEIVPGDGAQREWFTVAEPLLAVSAGQSVPFLVKLVVPAGTPAAPFWLQGRVYSADTAPEESSRLSERITGDVPPTMIKKPKPWWLIAVAALVVIVLGVVGWLVLRPDEPPPPTATPTPTSAPISSPTSSPTRIQIPDLTGLTEDEAKQTLTQLGLLVGAVKHRHVPGAVGAVTAQSLPAGQTADTGSAVDLEVAVELTAPMLTSPGNGAVFPAGSQPALTWQAVPGAGSYRVLRTFELCGPDPFGGCQELNLSDVVVTGTSWQPDPVPLPFLATGLVRWWVISMDDFGSLAQPSDNFEYRIAGQ